MIAIVILATFVVWLAHRLRRAESPEYRNHWQQALAIGAILFVIHSTCAIVAGIPGADCDIRIQVSKK
jgi:uncharacterized membrane protein YdjX (TVP38/TMEM64 family)